MREDGGCGFNYVSRKWLHDLPVAGQGWGEREGGDLLSVAATCSSTRAREGGWSQTLVGREYVRVLDKAARQTSRLSLEPLSLLGQAGVGYEVMSALPCGRLFLCRCASGNFQHHFLIYIYIN